MKYRIITNFYEADYRKYSTPEEVYEAVINGGGIDDVDGGTFKIHGKSGTVTAEWTWHEGEARIAARVGKATKVFDPFPEDYSFSSMEEARKFARSKGLCSNISVGRGFAMLFWDVELCFIEGFDEEDNDDYEREYIAHIPTDEEIYDFLENGDGYDALLTLDSVAALTAYLTDRFPTAPAGNIHRAVKCVRSLWDGLREDEDLSPVTD